jgi:hypothetical protein
VAREGRTGDHDDVEAGRARALESPEPLAQEPARAVALDGAPDPSAHRQAEAIEAPPVGRGHEQEELALETPPPLEDGVEVGPGPQSLARPEAHRCPREGVKRRAASAPSAGGA